MPESLGTNRRLLIVDDNPEIHADIKKILKVKVENRQLDSIESMMFGEFVAADGDGIEIDIDDAFQGQEALEFVQRSLKANRPYDVALVDMRMPPGWDGVETIEKLWKVDPDLQVVICTAYSDYSWDEVVSRLGVQDKLLIIKKPFDDCEILQSVRALSEKRRLLYEARRNMDTLKELVQLRTQELETMHCQSSSLLSAISAALIGLDRNKRITRWNAPAERLFRISQSAALGRAFAELDIPWHDHDFHSYLLQQLDQADEPHIESQITFEDATRFVSVSIYPIGDRDSSQGALVLVNDISERRELEHQLLQAQKLESVGQLAAGIAHEINTPMQYIGDNVRFLKRSFNQLKPVLECLSQLDPTAPSSASQQNLPGLLQGLNLTQTLRNLPSAIDDTELGIGQVTGIVRAMKEFSHPGTDKPQAIDLNHLLESVLVVSKSEWKYFATVDTCLDPCLPSIEGFSVELQQVFLNVIVNAAHAIASATENGAKGMGEISIATTHSATDCLICIKDNGIGIPKALQKRVFDPFFTTKEVGKGTGQGLTIAYTIIVRKHGGKIWLESEPSHGTTFFVQLPIHANRSDNCSEYVDSKQTAPSSAYSGQR